MNKILIINGHPDRESFNFGLSDAYKKGALKSGAEVKEIIIRELNFNPNLQFGYRKRTELEPDLLDAQEKIKWADHLVLIYPVWWDKLLKNKSARIISTLDQPAWYYWLIYREPSNNAMKKLTLQFSGISPVSVTTIGPIRLSKDTYRQNWLKKIERLGEQNK
jgi:putative NADPH-quinone reductase